MAIDDNISLVDSEYFSLSCAKKAFLNKNKIADVSK